MTGYEHITTLPYSKEENSIVERANREMTRHIRAFTYEYNEDSNIEELLPSVMRIVKTIFHESMGTSLSKGESSEDVNTYHSIHNCNILST